MSIESAATPPPATATGPVVTMPLPNKLDVVFARTPHEANQCIEMFHYDALDVSTALERYGDEKQSSGVVQRYLERVKFVGSKHARAFAIAHIVRLFKLVMDDHKRPSKGLVLINWQMGTSFTIGNYCEQIKMLPLAFTGRISCFQFDDFQLVPVSKTDGAVVAGAGGKQEQQPAGGGDVDCPAARDTTEFFGYYRQCLAEVRAVECAIELLEKGFGVGGFNGASIDGVSSGPETLMFVFEYGLVFINAATMEIERFVGTDQPEKHLQLMTQFGGYTLFSVSCSIDKVHISDCYGRRGQTLVGLSHKTRHNTIAEWIKQVGNKCFSKQLTFN